jgi:hypothetical protein
MPRTNAERVAQVSLLRPGFLLARGTQPEFAALFSTEGSWAFGAPTVMKNGSYSATTLTGRTALPFVISTEA